MSLRSSFSNNNYTVPNVPDVQLGAGRRPVSTSDVTLMLSDRSIGNRGMILPLLYGLARRLVRLKVGLVRLGWARGVRSGCLALRKMVTDVCGGLSTNSCSASSTYTLAENSPISARQYSTLIGPTLVTKLRGTAVILYGPE